MISDYHQKWMKKSDEQIAHMVSVKEQMLHEVLARHQAELPMPHPFLKVGVLGCKEKRMVELHRQMFERLFECPVEQWTFDIATEHLEGAEQVMQHDIVQPLPQAPFDLLLADVVIRFLEPQDQFVAIQNAYDGLAPEGMAVLFFGRNDVYPSVGYVPLPGTYPVDFSGLCQVCTEQGMAYEVVEHHVRTTVPGMEESIVIDDVSLVLRR